MTRQARRRARNCFNAGWVAGIVFTLPFLLADRPDLALWVGGSLVLSLFLASIGFHLWPWFINRYPNGG